MRLDEFLTSPTLIIKEAPEVGRDQPLGLNDPSILDQLESTGQDIEGAELVAKKFGDQLIFAIKNKVILSVLIGTEITDFPGPPKKSTIVINRTWTPTEMRGKGYSPALIDGLGRLDYRILSDKQISKNALAVWNKIARKRKLKAFDWNTKQYTTKDPLNTPSVSFVLEHEICFARSTLLEDSKVWTSE